MSPLRLAHVAGAVAAAQPGPEETGEKQERERGEGMGWGWMGVDGFVFCAHAALSRTHAHTPTNPSPPPPSVAFLDTVSATIDAGAGGPPTPPDAAGARLYLAALATRHRLEGGDVGAARAGVRAEAASLAALREPDATVAAAVHRTAALLAKVREMREREREKNNNKNLDPLHLPPSFPCVPISLFTSHLSPFLTAPLFFQATADYGAFYRSALRHLAFAPPASLPADDAAALAVDACLAALLAEDVWSFGDLVSHPLLDSLAGGPHAWLGDLVAALADGDLARYEALAGAHAGEMAAQPALAAAAGGRLREKATVLCLVAYLAGLPPSARRAVPLAAIGAAAGGLDGDGSEFLVAKAMAKGLVKGRVDGVAGTVDVAWVAPRTLTLPQVGALASRLEEWVGRVEATGRLLAEEGGALVGAA